MVAILMVTLLENENIAFSFFLLVSFVLAKKTCNIIAFENRKKKFGSLGTKKRQLNLS